MIKYDLDAIIALLEAESGETAILDTKLKTDYIFGNMTEDILTAVGFEYVGKSNKAGDVVPIYRLGNIEAIFNYNQLVVYEATV